MAEFIYLQNEIHCQSAGACLPKQTGQQDHSSSVSDRSKQHRAIILVPALRTCRALVSVTETVTQPRGPENRLRIPHRTDDTRCHERQNNSKQHFRDKITHLRLPKLRVFGE